jgi:hypothetical protein
MFEKSEQHNNGMKNGRAGQRMYAHIFIVTNADGYLFSFFSNPPADYASVGR